MHSQKSKGKSASFVLPNAHLAAEEWTMILEALRVYQHNKAYRPLYEKLAGLLGAGPIELLNCNDLASARKLIDE